MLDLDKLEASFNGDSQRDFFDVALKNWLPMIYEIKRLRNLHRELSENVIRHHPTDDQAVHGAT